MCKNYYVDADEFIRRYIRSKYSYKIYKDDVKNEYYFFTLRSCVVSRIYNDGKLNVRLAEFFAKVNWAISVNLLNDIRGIV